jgi:acylphosphatase
MESASRARVRVSGRVQGVFFRAETRKLASSLRLAGWVRNMEDGSVEAVFEGDRSLVERAIEWCNDGPSGANVESVEILWEKPVAEEGFRVR